jgi:hypothetical protein
VILAEVVRIKAVLRVDRGVQVRMPEDDPGLMDGLAGLVVDDGLRGDAVDHAAVAVILAPVIARRVNALDERHQDPS